MPTHNSLASLFTDIANAIRAKTGGSSSIVADNFPSEIASIPTGGGSTLGTKSISENGTYYASQDGYDGYSSVSVTVSGGGSGTDTSDATLTSGSQMLAGYTAYARGTKYTGSIQSKSSQTYTPSTGNQIISSGLYLSGAQTISGSENLVASNIKSGVDIFGVVGNYSGSGTDTSDATLLGDNSGYSSQMLDGVTAYARGTKYTGTIQSLGATNYTPGVGNQTITAGKYLSGNQTIFGDINLVPSNIRAGVTIFNITGTYTGGAGGWTITRLTSSDIVDVGGDSDDHTTYIDFNASSITGDIGAWVLFLSEADTLNATNKIMAAAGDSSANSAYADSAFRTSGVMSSANGHSSSNFAVTKQNGVIHVLFTAPSDNTTMALDTAKGYDLLVIHGNGGSIEFNQATVNPPSNATSVSFSGLSAAPVLYLLVMDNGSGFTINATHRAIDTVYWDAPVGQSDVLCGHTPYSGNIAYYTDFTSTYNNGTLTIASSGSDNGGYYHNPATYRLLYLTQADLGS